MKNIIRILIIEDHPEYRETMEFALNNEKDMLMQGEFGTAERALRYLQTLSTNDLPNVVLLDINLPGMSGMNAIRWIRDYAPVSKIIVLTQFSKEEYVLRAISQGASGYLLKSSTVDQITEGIRIVHKGGASIDSNLAKFILDTLKSKLPVGELELVLTERELQVLTLLSEGYVKKEIADRLNIENSTVVTHVSHIYAKLDARNAPAAIAKAFKLGILSVDER